MVMVIMYYQISILGDEIVYGLIASLLGFILFLIFVLTIFHTFHSIN
jgi:hypothetical protein